MMQPIKPVNISHLMSEWLSISMIFIIGEVVLRFGVFSSLVIVASFILAFISAFLIQKFAPLLFTYFRESKSLISLVRAIRFTEISVLHLYVCSIVLDLNYDVNPIYFIVVACFMILVYQYIAMRKGIQIDFKIIRFMIICGFAIILPSYIYLQKGLESLYHNLLYYQPHLLVHSSEELSILFIFSFIIFFSKLVLHENIIVTYQSTGVKIAISKLVIAIFTFCGFILAFATINIVAITQKIDVTFSNQIFILLIHKISSSAVFSVFCIALYIGSILILLDQFSDSGNRNRGDIKTFPFNSIMLCLSTVLTIIFFYHYSLLFIYTILGMMFSTVVFVILLISICKKLITKCKKS